MTDARDPWASASSIADAVAMGRITAAAMTDLTLDGLRH